MFSTSSMLDAVRLIRSGTVDALVPSWAAPVLLAMPCAGLAVAGLAGFGGLLVDAVRVLLALTVAGLFALAFHFLAGADVFRLGYGGWIAALGISLAVVAVVTKQPGPRVPRISQEKHQ